MLSLPVLAEFDPGGDVRRGLDDLIQLADCVLHVAAYRNVGRLVLIELRRIDIDVDDLGVLGERFELAGHAIVEPHAQGNQQIAVTHRPIGIDAAVHPQHVETERVVIWKGAQAHHRHRDGNAGLLHQLAQFFAGIA
jgi:hypothetical protein